MLSIINAWKFSIQVTPPTVAAILIGAVLYMTARVLQKKKSEVFIPYLLMGLFGMALHVFGFLKLFFRF